MTFPWLSMTMRAIFLGIIFHNLTSSLAKNETGSLHSWNFSTYYKMRVGWNSTSTNRCASVGCSGSFILRQIHVHNLLLFLESADNWMIITICMKVCGMVLLSADSVPNDPALLSQLQRFSKIHSIVQGLVNTEKQMNGIPWVPRTLGRSEVQVAPGWNKGYFHISRYNTKLYAIIYKAVIST